MISDAKSAKYTGQLYLLVLKIGFWAQMNLVRFNKSKSQFLHLGQASPNQYKLGDIRIEKNRVQPYHA